MLDARRLRQIKRLNRHPLNRAAAAHLPMNWRDGASLDLLALIQLAIEERAGEFRDPDLEGLEAALVVLDQSDPFHAMRVATRDESGEPMLTPDMLLGVDRQTAMYLVLEALHDSLASR